MIVSATEKRITAVTDSSGAFVEINLDPPKGAAQIRTWMGYGPVVLKTIPKRNADYRAAVEAYNDLKARVKT